MKPKTMRANFLALAFSSFSHSTTPAEARPRMKSAQLASCASRMNEGAGKYVTATLLRIRSIDEQTE